MTLIYLLNFDITSNKWGKIKNEARKFDFDFNIKFSKSGVADKFNKIENVDWIIRNKEWYIRNNR